MSFLESEDETDFDDDDYGIETEIEERQPEEVEYQEEDKEPPADEYGDEAFKNWKQPTAGWKTKRRRERRRRLKHRFPFENRAEASGGNRDKRSFAAAAKTDHPDPKDIVDGHLDSYNRDALVQLIKEETGEGGKRIVKPAEVRTSTGAIQELWKTSAEVELTSNFQKCGAYHVSTAHEIASYGHPLPMLCVWSETPDVKKCRACICGNFAKVDPLQQSWTAQAEPSSLIASLKLGCQQGWTASKHDVKGAFLNASLPEGKLVVVRPPDQWVKWGLVKPGELWTLDKAVYGLRESPYLWSQERDKQLSDLKWTIGSKTYKLSRCDSDSQVWRLVENQNKTILGLMVVYVDDFLLQTIEGPIRDGLLTALKKVWTLAKEETLTADHSITFLGIDLVRRVNGDVYLHQSEFVHSILKKHDKANAKGNPSVQIDKLPTEPDIPTPAELKSLQQFSGEFNWLATRTRPDISYYTSVLASACSRYAKWSFEIAQKILRYLVQTSDQGILLTAAGDLNQLVAWTDAGFAGTDTKSQNGLIITWGGSIIVWRSSRQTVSALSTAEAELNSAAVGWQIIEGLRLLIADLGVQLPDVKVLVDNQAAITITKCGANWRTRYFAVRGHRLHEECETGIACPDPLACANPKHAGGLHDQTCSSGSDRCTQDVHESGEISTI